ncbi:unnamed protein product [Dibothriocephalus latus]|uniref:Uncharacterized protein n=1 Tax=Dibothriocephalus latus TaxID=60516 RepID=A0A3P7P374_DIBLA|nr:unnamed protein product [Dibothriocephalus latus]
MSDHDQKHGEEASKQQLQEMLDAANAENAHLRAQLEDLMNRVSFLLSISNVEQLL